MVTFQGKFRFWPGKFRETGTQKNQDKGDDTEASRMVNKVEKRNQSGYNNAAAGERRAQQTSEWMLRKRAFQSKFRPPEYAVKRCIPELKTKADYLLKVSFSMSSRLERSNFQGTAYSQESQGPCE